MVEEKGKVNESNGSDLFFNLYFSFPFTNLFLNPWSKYSLKSPPFPLFWTLLKVHLNRLKMPSTCFQPFYRLKDSLWLFYTVEALGNETFSGAKFWILLGIWRNEEFIKFVGLSVRLHISIFCVMYIGSIPARCPSL